MAMPARVSIRVTSLLSFFLQSEAAWPFDALKAVTESLTDEAGASASQYAGVKCQGSPHASKI